MSIPVYVKRGTRAQIDAAATAGELANGQPYLITDEGRLAVGTGTNTYKAAEVQGEGTFYCTAGYTTTLSVGSSTGWPFLSIGSSSWIMDGDNTNIGTSSCQYFDAISNQIKFKIPVIADIEVYLNIGFNTSAARGAFVLNKNGTTMLSDSQMIGCGNTGFSNDYRQLCLRARTNFETNDFMYIMGTSINSSNTVKLAYGNIGFPLVPNRGYTPSVLVVMKLVRTT